MMSDIEIRQLTLDDVEAYRDIRLEMLRDNPENFGESYEDNLEYELDFFENRIANSPIYGGFQNGILLATAGYFIQRGAKVCHKAMVWGVYVKPESRGYRLSQKLIEKNIKDCSQYVEQVLIHISAKNISALKVYQDIGFKEFGCEPNARKIGGKYFDEISMVKFLKT
jgi:ribosomal protein S18 acetylase RimI-like enzyme